ncbi:MAG TPA: sugar-binding domain-containing protein [Bacteroidales bacterium]
MKKKEKRNYRKVLCFMLSFQLVSMLTFSQVKPGSLQWKLMAQSDVSGDGEKISSPGFQSEGWINAVVPGTVFYSYVVAGKESNPDFADNIYKVDHAKYNKPYWYRAEFTAPLLSSDKRLWLSFNGIHKIAEIYVNGHHLGTLKGLMERGKFDITGIVNNGKANAIAVLIIPPFNDPEHHHPLANFESPTYVCSAGWDWMPPVPGFNSGITDSVTLNTTGTVCVEDPWIRTELPRKDLANLTLNVTLRNAGSSPVTGNVTAVINPGNIRIKGSQITIDANNSKNVTYTRNDFPMLSIKNPELWWPNGYGGKADGSQHLYTCTVSFEINHSESSDAVTKTFGIRKVTSDTTSLNGPMRVYINDVPILIKGGNWGMSDYMLKVRGADYEPRIRFHKEMNYNMIRNWTGEVTDEAFYDYCDKYGIMVWDDFWLNNFGPIDSLDIFKRNAIEKVKKFRNHPSIVIWCGANEGVPGGNPTGPLNMAIKNAVKEYDGDDKLYIARSNAGEKNPNFSIHGGSRILSGSGIWGNVDPKTYFTDPHNGYLFSKDNYGMRSELGAATFVNVESFKKFMPADYWVPPTPESVSSNTNMWAKHYFCTDGALGGGSDPVRYINDINHRYGPSATIDEFCKKAQLMNLETLKAMYEAWNDHMWNNASGMLIWMSQSAYPTMIWQTYDYYFDLTGAYFGSKSACEPVHIQWNAATNSIKVINNKPYNLKKVTAYADVYNSNGKLVPEYSQKAVLDVNASSVREAFVAFDSTKQKPALSDVHFLKLKLTDAKGKLLSENFYWMGNTYLDYTALNKLPAAGNDLVVGKPVISKANDSCNTLLTYTLTNKSQTTAIVGIRAQLLNDKGEQILPAIFDDGYFSLMQGEVKILHVEVGTRLLGDKYTLSLKAYND